MLRIVIAGPDEALSLWLAAAIAPAQELELVGTALDGDEALELVVRTHPDVVVVDIDTVLPSEDGLSLVAAIKDAVPETVVVAVAADARTETAVAALEAGAIGVLGKDGSAELPSDLDGPEPGASDDLRSRPWGRHEPPRADSGT